MMKRWWKDEHVLDSKGPIDAHFLQVFGDFPQSPHFDHRWDLGRKAVVVLSKLQMLRNGRRPRDQPWKRKKKQTENKKHGEWCGMLSCFFWYWSDIFVDRQWRYEHHFCVDVLRWGHPVIPSLVAKFTSIGPTCEPNQSKLTQFESMTSWWFGTWILFFRSVGNVIIPTR